MTVREMIDWLSELNPEAELTVLMVPRDARPEMYRFVDQVVTTKTTVELGAVPIA